LFSYINLPPTSKSPCFDFESVAQNKFRFYELAVVR
jgi:hypothetical protein